LSHDITGVKEVHESMKLFGKGVKIGIIDSGVDYTHPALGGCFGPGCKVAYGTDFVGDDGHSPDDDPKSDCDGHGTHVAGIIAAKDHTFVGVAPEATLGAYRVFGCRGGTSNDLIMKALLKAAEDGMQVINLSLGGPGGWRQDREAHLADQLARNGTVIVAAMGNEGQMGLFEASSPGVAGALITVASTENEFRSNLYFNIKRSSKTKRVHRDHEDEDEDGKISPGTSGKVKGDACAPISLDLKNKIALIRRGDCTFKVKVANAAQAGAVGVILMDNAPSSGLAADTEGATIKVRTIALADGEFLLQTIEKEKKQSEGIKLQDGHGPKRVFNPLGGSLSLFSSMGPDSELNSKPDVAAPGGQIWSTFPVKLGSYASLSGTSMATPYIVGCVALYLEGHPNGDHSAEAIKTAFQNNGQPRNDQQTDFKGYASVTQQGAGLI
ncbi:MAG: peptidase S8/S53 domain-containing protein, partial [Podila humilis]